MSLSPGRRSAAPLAVLVLAVGLGLAFAPLAPAAGPEGGLDGRSWELVSPVDKNGGQVGAPGSEAAGMLAAAAGALAFGSASSFGEAEGSLPVNQYLALRGGSGWSTENLTPPALSGTYAAGAYQLFSEELSRAVLDGGSSCRDGSDSCPAENTPLGPGGPSGYRNLYLREGATYAPLVTTSNSPSLAVSASDFRLFAAGASPDLRHVIISTCAVLMPGATEVPATQGCDPGAQNLYAWEAGQLRLVNILPGETESAPGAALAAARGAVSADGSRVYWTHGGNLYLRDGEASTLVAAGVSFQVASRDGSLAFFTQGEHLYRYTATTDAVTDLTPGGSVLALVGSSDDGSALYYVAGDGLYRLEQGVATQLAFVGAAQLPPASGPARASADGKRFFFTSTAALHFRDTNLGSDAYEWEAQGIGSCQRTGGCLGLISNGRAGSSIFVDASASGDDAFFATSTSLVASDPDYLDIYDARVGGGFSEPVPSICIGDDCQGPAPAPDFAIPPTESLRGRPNPRVAFPKRHHRHRRRHGHHRLAHHRHNRSRAR